MELLLRIKSLDVMAQPVNLNVQGRNGFKTIFGVVMTVGYFTGVVAIAFYIGLTYFDTTTPTVVSQTTEESIYPRQNMAENHILPVVFLSTPFGQLYPATQVLKYTTPLFYQLTMNTSVDSAGVPTTKYVVKQIPMLPCSKVISDPVGGKLYQTFWDKSPLFKTNGTTSGFCANTTAEELYVEGGSNDLLQSYLILELYPCSLADTSKCATPLELMGVRVGNLGPTISMDLSKFENPISTNVQIGPVYALSEQLLQKYSYKLARTQIKDISGPTGESKIRVNYSTAVDPIVNSGSRVAAQMTCTPAQILAKTCVPFMSFYYASSGLKTEITRTYKTIMRTLSEIGGMNSFAFIIFYYSSLLFAHFTKRENFIKMIFPFIYSKEFQEKVSEESKDDKGVFSKNLFKENMSRIKDEAYNSIVRCLDVLNIVKEMNNLKILTHIMMNKHHRAMAPLVALNIHQDAPTMRISRRAQSVNMSAHKQGAILRTPESFRYNQVKGAGNKPIEVVETNVVPEQPLTFVESIKYLKSEANRVRDIQRHGNAGTIVQPTLEEQSSVFCMHALQRPESLLGFVLKHSADTALGRDLATPMNKDYPRAEKAGFGEYAKTSNLDQVEEAPEKFRSGIQERLNSSIVSPGLGKESTISLATDQVRVVPRVQTVQPKLDNSTQPVSMVILDAESPSRSPAKKISSFGLRNGSTTPSQPKKKLTIKKPDKQTESPSQIRTNQQP